MIRRFLSHWASKLLASQRKDPRDAVRAKARQMCRDMGREIPEAIR